MDWTQILIALVTALPTILAALAAFWKLNSGITKLHVEINSRMTELLSVTRASGFTEGVAQERANRDKIGLNA